uniref:Fgenesh protein 121 n=1 Tax=Beta vulgaris TaxID=161934 RepID=Q20CC3_BETVU|nr:Fgenesh protein 121 [Beta vulgaris]
MKPIGDKRSSHQTNVETIGSDRLTQSYRQTESLHRRCSFLLPLRRHHRPHHVRGTIQIDNAKSKYLEIGLRRKNQRSDENEGENEKRERSDGGGSHNCRGERNRSQLHGLVFVVGRSKMSSMRNEEEGESERKAELE